MTAGQDTLKDFWRRFSAGVEVAVAGSGFLHDKLLGVRDGFCRYFGDCLALKVPVAVTPYPGEEISTLPMTDQETLELARSKALDLRRRIEDPAIFVVGSEAGLLTMQAGDQSRILVRSWTVILGLDDEAWGASGSVQIPARLLGGPGDFEMHAVPGTRRGGGMVAELTGNLETRRTATSLATVQALSTLCYGLIDRHPGRRR